MTPDDIRKLTDRIEVLRDALKRSKRHHYQCEDSWYSCPKANEGCSDKDAGTDCNCGVDKYNALVDSVEYDDERYDCPIHGLQDGPDCPRC